MEKHTNKIGHEESCNKGSFKRLRYFHGMMLDEKNLKLEQDYHREKQKLHNRMHGFGVVWGLEVAINKDDKCDSCITMGHGFALDCEGNEIIVCDERKIYQDELKEIILGEDKCVKIKDEYCIGIKYCDFESDLVTQYITSCDTDNLQQENSLVREGYRIVVMKKEKIKEFKDEGCKRPCNYCDGAVPPWCKEDNHIIVLRCAKIEEGDDGKLTIGECEKHEECCERLDFSINLPKPKPCNKIKSGKDDASVGKKKTGSPKPKKNASQKYK